MKTTIKIFCVMASFTMFSLSTVGLEMEDSNIECPIDEREQDLAIEA